MMKYPPAKASGFPLGLDMDFYRTLPALMKSIIKNNYITEYSRCQQETYYIAVIHKI